MLVLKEEFRRCVERVSVTGSAKNSHIYRILVLIMPDSDLGLAAVGLTIPPLIFGIAVLALHFWMWRAVKKAEAEKRVLDDKVSEESE